MDHLEKRYCPNCGALMTRKQINYELEVGSILDRSYNTSMPLPAHQVYWECPNCTPEVLPPPPGPPPDYF